MNSSGGESKGETKDSAAYTVGPGAYRACIFLTVRWCVEEFGVLRSDSSFGAVDLVAYSCRSLSFSLFNNGNVGLSG